MSEETEPESIRYMMRELDEAKARLQRVKSEQEQRVADRTRELAESEARYRALVESLQDMVFLCDARGTLTEVSGNSMGITGYTAEELRATVSLQKLSALLFSNNAPVLVRAVEQAGSSQMSSRVKCQLGDRAGETRWVEVVLVPIRSDEDVFVGLHGTIRDVSERMQTEQMLQSLNVAAGVVQQVSLSLDEVLDAVTDQLTDLGFFSMIAFPDESGQEMLIAKVCGDERALQALESASGLGRSGLRLPIDGIPAWAEAILDRSPVPFGLDERFWSRLIADSSVSRSVIRILPPLRAVVVPLVADDKVLGLLSVAGRLLPPAIVSGVAAFANQTAISIRNAQLVTRLSESEAQYRGIFEAATDGLLVVDRDGVIAEASPAACSMYGYPHDELVGLPVATLVEPQCYGDLRSFQQSVTTQGDSSIQSVSVRKDGSRLSVHLRGSRLSFRGEAHLLAVVTDITERVRTQEALVQTERLRALGQMAGGIAHDFNNILVGIRGYADLALRNLREDPELVRHDLECILVGSGDAAEAVRRLQSLYRQVDDTSDFLPIQVDEVVSEALALTKPRWKDQSQVRGVTIHVETDLAAPPLVLGNAGELCRVFTNLVVNAIDAMPDEGTLSIRTGHDAQWSTVAVSDTGIGMSEQERLRVFEPFFTTKKSSGLGLTVSLNAINRHGGEILVESTLGRGTTFVVRLPIEPEELETVPFRPPVVARARDLERCLRILVVDDEPVVLELLVTFLERARQSVTSVGSGQEALALLETESFDLVITDLGMPDVSGHQVAQLSHSLHPEVPVVLATGWGETITTEQLAEMKATTLLPKPFTHEDLMAVLRQVCRD